MPRFVEFFGEADEAGADLAASRPLELDRILDSPLSTYSPYRLTLTQGSRVDIRRLSHLATAPAALGIGRQAWTAHHNPASARTPAAASCRLALAPCAFPTAGWCSLPGGSCPQMSTRTSGRRGRPTWPCACANPTRRRRAARASSSESSSTTLAPATTRVRALPALPEAAGRCACATRGSVTGGYSLYPMGLQPLLPTVTGVPARRGPLHNGHRLLNLLRAGLATGAATVL